MSITTNTTTTTIKIDGYTFTTKEAFDDYVELNGLYIHDDEDDALLNCNISLVLANVVSVGNPQVARSAYIDEDDLAYETAQIQLTATTEYHRGFGATVADELRHKIRETYLAMTDKSNPSYDEYYAIGNPYIVELDQDFVDEYNNHVNEYNRYGDLSEIKSMLTSEELIDLML